MKVGDVVTIKKFDKEFCENGLWFLKEMLQFCGKKYKVRKVFTNISGEEKIRLTSIDNKYSNALDYSYLSQWLNDCSNNDKNLKKYL